MFTVGQKVWWVHEVLSYHGTVTEVEVTKVGRRWVALSNGYRCDIKTFRADGGKYGLPGRIFLSQGDYDRSLQVREAWDGLRVAIASQYAVPSHLSAEEIVAMQQKIFPVEPSTDEVE